MHSRSVLRWPRDPLSEHQRLAVTGRADGERPARAPDPIRWFAGAVVALVTVWPLYIIGVFDNGLLGATDLCPDGELRELHEQRFPLRSTCRYQDGHSHELAAPFVNGPIFFLLGLTVLLLALGTRAAVQAARSPRPSR